MFQVLYILRVQGKALLRMPACLNDAKRTEPAASAAAAAAAEYLRFSSACVVEAEQNTPSRCLTAVATSL